MSIFNKLMDSKEDLIVYCKNKSCFKYVNITDVTPTGESFILELTNSEIGKGIYGEKQTIISSDYIERILLPERNSRKVL